MSRTMARARWPVRLVWLARSFALTAATATIASRTVGLPQRGLRMQYSVALPPSPSARPQRPPLVFVHGTFHSSWCWAEHWLGFFAQRGHEAYAISLRGTSGSPEPTPRRISVDEHVDDLAAFLTAVVGRPAVLVGHSFGGAYVQKLLERGEPAAAGAVLLCSVPPSGNGAMIWRFLRRSPLSALRITRGFALKSACTSVDDASRLFFSAALPPDEVRRHMTRFAEDSACSLDVPDFNRKLPSRGARADERPAWVRACPPMLVLGAERDAVVDAEAIEEAAAFYGASSAMLPGLGHDVMLVPGWERAADAISDWLASPALAATVSGGKAA